MKKEKTTKSSNFENLRTTEDKKTKEIYLAVLLRILTGFQGLINKLLPQNTKGREIYNFVIFSTRIFKEKGLRVFIHQVKARNLERYIISSKVPIVETKIIQQNATLSLTKTLQGSFFYPTNNLNRINILTNASQRKNSKIKLQIIDERETVVREVAVKDSEIKDNGYTSFKFKPIEKSANKIFYFTLKSMGESSASILYDETEETKKVTLFYGNETLNGSIGFQVFSDLGIQPEYDLWMLTNKLTSSEIENLKKEIQNFEYRPKISIIMPVYNVDKLWLEKAIDSVRNQLYTNWELCIADDASSKNHIKRILEKYSELDSRIKIRYLSKNLGISGASNEALSLATGEFVGLLDNDDELSVDALYEVAKLLNKKPKTDFIYSDEDKIDMTGHCCKPFFKPDWSPDILFSVNYISHFSVIRKKIVEEAGKFRSGFDGSQDYDLFLRVAEKTNNIEHIPRILYHWRIVPGSTASDANAKDKAHINGINALQSYLERQKIEGVVSSGSNRTSYHIDYTIKEDPLVSIIIHFNDNMPCIKKCIKNIFKNTAETRYEILLLMPNRKEKPQFLNFDPTGKQLDVRILTYDLPLNISAIKNLAAEKANGDYLLFLSSQIEVATKNWLNYLLMNAQRKEIGCVGPKILNLDGIIKQAGIVFGKNWETCNVFSELPENSWTNFGLDTWSRNYLSVGGECLMISKDKFFQAGGFDNTLKNHANDIDLCLRIYQKGYRNLCTQAVSVYHFRVCSRKEKLPNNYLQEILRLHKSCIENGDPFYNPNLSLREDSCKLNIPY